MLNFLGEHCPPKFRERVLEALHAEATEAYFEAIKAGNHRHAKRIKRMIKVWLIWAVVGGLLAGPSGSCLSRSTQAINKRQNVKRASRPFLMPEGTLKLDCGGYLVQDAVCVDLDGQRLAATRSTMASLQGFTASIGILSSVLHTRDRMKIPAQFPCLPPS